MKHVALTRGLFALVDDEDYEAIVAAGTWQARPSNRGSTWYAARRSNKDRGSKQTYLHRFILGLGAGRNPMVDHRDGNGLNNCRANLRLASPSQNAASRVGFNSSGFKGVTAAKNQWVVRLGRKGACIGRFDDPVEAAYAYDVAARQIYGEFARLNFPRAGELSCSRAA